MFGDPSGSRCRWDIESPFSFKLILTFLLFALISPVLISSKSCNAETILSIYKYNFSRYIEPCISIWN